MVYTLLTSTHPDYLLRIGPVWTGKSTGRKDYPVFLVEGPAGQEWTISWPVRIAGLRACRMRRVARVS